MEERIKPDQLKEALTEIFSEYGNVIDLVAKQNLKAKGQAFIVFDGVEAAERALKEVQGFELFDKPMQLDYAKTKSDAIVQRENPDEFEVHKRRRLAEKGMAAYVPHLRFQIMTDLLNHRKKASCRSCRSTKETQTTCRRSSTRTRRVTPSQSCPWRWS